MMKASPVASAKKTIYESVRAMDTPDEKAAAQMARQVIGNELFHYLLNHEITYAEAEGLSTSFG